MIENFIETNESIVFSDKGFISLSLIIFVSFFCMKTIRLGYG